MKTLLVLRHAKSSWKDGSLKDHDRPLNKRGRRDAPRMGRLLREEGLLPDLIVSSTADRARTTAVAIGENAGYEAEVEFRRSLYGASAETILRVLSGVPDDFERVLIVGHNPGLEDLLSLLCGYDDALPTAALAQLTLPLDHWRDLTAETPASLVRVWRPKELAG